jgi:hypothetical protein
MLPRIPVNVHVEVIPQFLQISLPLPQHVPSYWIDAQPEDSHSQRVFPDPLVTEYSEPTVTVAGQDDGLVPTTQVGQFGLVVKCEFPRKLLFVLPPEPY